MTMTTLTMTYPRREYIRSAASIPIDEATRECARRAYGPGAVPGDRVDARSTPGRTIYTFRVQLPSPVTPKLTSYVGNVTFDLVQ